MAVGFLIRRNHSLTPEGTIYIHKMLGGGSLIIAFPALLGLKKKYPRLPMVLVTSRSLVPFAESLNLFDKILPIEDTSVFRLVFSSLRVLYQCFGGDTFIDLEVHSRLTTVLSGLTACRNRIGFYTETAFWRKYMYTHLLFFNRTTGVFQFYDNLVSLLGAEAESIETCRKKIISKFTTIESPGNIVIGAGCSDLAKERMLSARQWRRVFLQRLNREEKKTLIFLGSKNDAHISDEIIRESRPYFPQVDWVNACGKLSLADSLEKILNAGEFWGIDSALLHYARIFGKKCVSFWGPTNPQVLLRPMKNLIEEVYYERVSCSPCVHLTEQPPCGGNTVCLAKIFDSSIQEHGVVIESRAKSLKRAKVGGRPYVTENLSSG